MKICRNKFKWLPFPMEFHTFVFEEPFYGIPVSAPMTMAAPAFE